MGFSWLYWLASYFLWCFGIHLIIKMYHKYNSPAVNSSIALLWNVWILFSFHSGQSTTSQIVSIKVFRIWMYCILTMIQNFNKIHFMCDLPDPFWRSTLEWDKLHPTATYFSHGCEENCTRSSDAELNPAVVLAVATRGIHRCGRNYRKLSDSFKSDNCIKFSSWFKSAVNW